jgi:outer membrane protein, heavy metal efflux system
MKIKLAEIRIRRPATVAVALFLLVGGLWAEGVQPPQTLPQILSEVYSLHPSLRAAQLRLAASQAWAQGAGSQPNPELRLSVPRGDPSEEANAFVQRLQIAGQTGLRSKIAELQAQQKNAGLLALHRQLSMRVADAYWTLWATRESERLLDLRLQLTSGLALAGQRRLQAGEISENQKLRIELEKAQAEAQLASARGQRKTALSNLNILLQRPSDQEFLLPENVLAEDHLAEPTREGLLSSVEIRPEVRVANLTAEIQHLEADLLGKQRAPDLEFEAYRSSLAQGSEQGVRVSLVLPLWDWGGIGAAVEQKQREAEAADSETKAQRQTIEQEVLAVWDLYVAEKERRQILRGQVERYLKQADLARRGYEAGLLSLLEVIESQRAYRDAMLEYVSAEASFRKKRWDIYWLTGGVLPLPAATEGKSE